MLLCASLKNEKPQLIAEANRTADLIELRLDLFKPHDLKKLRQKCLKPVIFKLDCLKKEYLDVSPDYIDLAFGTPLEIFQKLKEVNRHVKTIISYHDFEKTPSLDEIFFKLQKYPADYFKIATYARSTIDALNMLLFVKKKENCIGVCMGEKGEITRTLAPVVNMPWTYAAIKQEEKTADGQLTLFELLHTYNFRFHSPKTQLYGLLGNPIFKSPGHRIHNFAFNQLGLDAVYVKMAIEKEELDLALSLCKRLGFKGLSVTMPLKEKAASLIGGAKTSINTLHCQSGKWKSVNTDGKAVVDAIEKKMSIKNKRVVILGAGGTAHAVALACKKKGASIRIMNRTLIKAENIANDLGGEAFPLTAWKEISEEGYDILINCTSVGFDNSKSPVDTQFLLKKKLVVDVIHTTKETTLVKAAKLKMCSIINGMEIFILQAVEQYCFWGIGG